MKKAMDYLFKSSHTSADVNTYLEVCVHVHARAHARTHTHTHTVELGMVRIQEPGETSKCRMSSTCFLSAEW